ncbi:MAG: hypothetical protein MPEBLZ_04496, partial [Candidatus Methanoperedens nitroreducens]
PFNKSISCSSKRQTLVKRRKKKTSNGFLFVALIFILMVIILAGYIYISENPAVIDGIPNQPDSQPVITPTGPPATNTSPNNTVKLAAFNLQIFGTTKAGRPEVMDVLSKTIRNFDIVAVQEIRDASQTSLPALKNSINDMAGPKYDFVVGERLAEQPAKSSIHISTTPRQSSKSGPLIHILIQMTCFIENHMSQNSKPRTAISISYS